jgi:putative spermidine/putrescine transport system ATP-binding protein
MLRLEGCAAGRLAPVDVDVGAGDVVILLGDVDDGVGGLLSCALGLQAPHSGRALLFDVDATVADHDMLLALRQRVALASLQAPLLSNMNVRDNLVIPLAMRSQPEARVRADVEALLAELELSSTLLRRPHELTPRQHREILLARALLLPVDLYLLDEPPLSSRLLGRLPSLIERGAAVVVTTTAERLVRALSSTLPSLKVVRLATAPAEG